MLTRIRSAAVVGVEASPIEVEVDVAGGLPGFSIVGLPDTGVKEGRTRIRGALDNIGSKLPPRKVTVNLAPADIRKDGAAYDLPIAVGILTGSGLLPEDCANDALFVGELALDGRVRPVRGVLPMAAWARRRGLRRMYVPRDNAAEAAVAGGDTAVLPVGSLNELIATLKGETPALPMSVPANETTAETAGTPDMSEIRGQETARRALEIAAAGGHNLLFVGPPGSGKTLLSRRLPGILPSLTFEEALETTMVYSVAGMLGHRALIRERPFRAPHHTVSVAGLAGGGPMVRPGEISLAHNGVLFLDELLEFSRPVLETLRQPLEERSIAIVRARRTVSFPASFQLVAATNPCPCGHFGNPRRTCTCSQLRIESYRARLSGPLLDRIDLHVHVPAMAYRELAAGEPGEASATVRARVEAARTRQRIRDPRPNATLPTRALAEVVQLDAEANRLMERAVDRLALSARAIDRVRRLARTIADLEGCTGVAAGHLAEALQYRLLDQPTS
jgi:magnesium chelatase family protein